MRILSNHKSEFTWAKTREVTGMSGGISRAETGIRSLFYGFKVSTRGNFVKTSIGYKRIRKWRITCLDNDLPDISVYDHVYIDDAYIPYVVTNVVKMPGTTLYECEIMS
jgi:hypothetical protein